MGGLPKIMGFYPQSIHFVHRVLVFHYFHHPFRGKLTTPLFLVQHPDGFFWLLLMVAGRKYQKPTWKFTTWAPNTFVFFQIYTHLTKCLHKYVFYVCININKYIYIIYIYMNVYKVLKALCADNKMFS